MKKPLLFTASLLLTLGTAHAQKTTLNYWSMWNQTEPQGQVIQATIKDFEAAHPGVNVQVNWLGRQVKNLILPALDTGTSIDVFDTGTDWMKRYNKHLLALDPYLKRPSMDNPKQTVAQSLYSILQKQYQVAGKNHFVVYQPFAVLFFYNKDHFQKAGIKAEPKNWEEFLTVSNQLRKAGFEPLTTDIDAYIDVMFGYFVERYAGGCNQLSRTLKDKTGKMWLTTPGYLKLAQNVQELLQKGYFAKGTAGNRYPTGQQRLALGEVSMYLNGTWLPGEVKATTGPEFKWGTFGFPAISGGNGKVTTVMMGSQALAIPKASKNPELAFQFIEFMVGKKTQQAMVKAGFTSARKDLVWQAPLDEAWKQVNDAKQAIGWACELGEAGELGDNVITPALTDLFTGKSSPEAFVQRLQKDTAAFWKTRR
ncbi:ABC transporter substrate-binding protein [Deinococcus misasensis]|uniref:ABC transporter substrate-binding protein n=1 Tax=Deinococcus misasensis TaxID=392413 RepID=UPI00068C2F76|nr:extracellular solute-binding protein [Deinococcus misasensis]